jgi:pre-mRNA-splicing factor CWC22
MGNWTINFIAHLVNRAVTHGLIILPVFLLLERRSDDSIGFTDEIGDFLAENSPKANVGVYECFRLLFDGGAISEGV